MKSLKFAFASLLLAVAAMTFSASSIQAQVYRKFKGNVSISNFVSSINTVTTASNWDIEQSTEPTISDCPTGTTKLCYIKLRVTSGSIPTFNPNILDALNDYFNPSIGNHPFPGCGMEFDLTVGTQIVKVTFGCKS